MCPGDLVQNLKTANLLHFFLCTLPVQPRFNLPAPQSDHTPTQQGHKSHAVLGCQLSADCFPSIFSFTPFESPDRWALQPHVTEEMTGAQKGWSHHRHTTVQSRSQWSNAGCLISRLEFLRGTFLCLSSVWITNQTPPFTTTTLFSTWRLTPRLTSVCLCW